MYKFIKTNINTYKIHKHSNNVMKYINIQQNNIKLYKKAMISDTKGLHDLTRKEVIGKWSGSDREVVGKWSGSGQEVVGKWLVHLKTSENYFLVMKLSKRVFCVFLLGKWSASGCKWSASGREVVGWLQKIRKS